MVTQHTWLLPPPSLLKSSQKNKKYHTGDNPFNVIEAIPSVMDSINSKPTEMVLAMQSLSKGMDVSGFS